VILDVCLITSRVSMCLDPRARATPDRSGANLLSAGLSQNYGEITSDDVGSNFPRSFVEVALEFAREFSPGRRRFIFQANYAAPRANPGGGRGIDGTKESRGDCIRARGK